MRCTGSRMKRGEREHAYVRRAAMLEGSARTCASASVRMSLQVPFFCMSHAFHKIM